MANQNWKILADTECEDEEPKRDWVKLTYEVIVKNEHLHREFSDEEKRVLRPIAETIAMLDGNAFFNIKVGGDKEWYEQYLPEAHALFEQNGGLTGWAGSASWIEDLRQETPAVKDAYENYRILKSLSQGAADAKDKS